MSPGSRVMKEWKAVMGECCLARAFPALAPLRKLQLSGRSSERTSSGGERTRQQHRRVGTRGEDCRRQRAARDERERASQSAVATSLASLSRGAFGAPLALRMAPRLHIRLSLVGTRRWRAGVVAAPLCWGVGAASPPSFSLLQLLQMRPPLLTGMALS
jgi:hypothetical protein